MNAPHEELPPAVPGGSGVGVLSAIVGHELNNIAVPLQSFSDLALESTRHNDPVREYLDEMRIAIGRIKALAHELGSLGEFSSDRAIIPIKECFAAETDDGEPLEWKIDWQTGRESAVEVDRFHARRAIEALARFGSEGARRTRPLLTVTRKLPAAAVCAACFAPIVSPNEGIQVRMPATLVRQDEFHQPLSAARPERLIRRLSVAVLVHCTHCAGGHILLDEASDLLSLVFATAVPIPLGACRT